MAFDLYLLLLMFLEMVNRSIGFLITSMSIVNQASDHGVTIVIIWCFSFGDWFLERKGFRLVLQLDTLMKWPD